MFADPERRAALNAIVHPRVGELMAEWANAAPDGGIQVVKKDDFLAGIAKRQAFFQSIGFQFVKLLPLDETRLDDHYVMVKVHSHMRFEKNPGQPVDLEDSSTYILFIQDDSPRIVFYTTHEDLMQIMQDRGLLPAKQ